MAWIEKRTRGDGGVSARVVWRLGGTRDGAYQAETFSAGTDAQNLARAAPAAEGIAPSGSTTCANSRGLAGRRRCAAAAHPRQGWATSPSPPRSTRTATCSRRATS